MDILLDTWRLIDVLLDAARRWSYRRLYLRSRHWREVRQNAIRLSFHKCQDCGKTGPLDVHHRSYAHLGDERRSDLVVLCRYCHAERHALKEAARKWT